jgi:hypothetical protein
MPQSRAAVTQVKRVSVRDQSAKRNRYAITALKDRRATRAGEIETFRPGIQYWEEQLAHLNAVLVAFAPEYRLFPA